MQELPGDGGQVVHADGRVVGSGRWRSAKKPLPFVLREPPPGGTLADWDQRSASGLGAAEGWLRRSEFRLLGPRGVPLVAGDSAEQPRSPDRQRRNVSIVDGEPGRKREPRPRHGLDAVDSPVA